MLPHVVVYNTPAILTVLTRMRRALQNDNPAAALYELTRSNGTPHSLRELGMAAVDLDRAAERAVADLCWNPR